MTATDQALWTPERANRALPLVRRIADDLVNAYRRWQELVERYELASLRSTATSAIRKPSCLRAAFSRRLPRSRAS